jgi:putative membrane protein
MLLKHTCLAGSLFAFLTLALVYGQEDSPRPERGARAPSSAADAVLIAWLIQDNENEVALAQLAQQKASSNEVKEFSKLMLRDHSSLLSKLHKSSTAAGEAQSKQGREAGSLDIIALKKELGRQCLASAKRELEQKSGAEFDKCYMYSQVGAHMGAVDTLTVFQNHASGEFKDMLAEGLPVVKGHLDHARSLAKKLDGGSADKSGGPVLTPRTKESSDR